MSKPTSYVVLSRSENFNEILYRDAFGHVLPPVSHAVFGETSKPRGLFFSERYDMSDLYLE
jgi:hypothetical protein